MILAVLQARFSSTRLPGKVLRPIMGRPMLALQIERILRSKKIDKLVVATSTDSSDTEIEKLCRDLKVSCFRGSLDDVLDRFYQATLAHSPEHVVRLTGDCPLIDPEVIDQVIGHHLEHKSDYTSNSVEATFPDGLDVEIVNYPTLVRAWREARLPSQREHVTPFIHSQPKVFKVQHFKNAKDFSALRWTVDTEADFIMVREVFNGIYKKNPTFLMQDVLDFLKLNPATSGINAGQLRNEGLKVSMKKDKIFARYEKSTRFHAEVLKVIPLASQTFSKSHTQYPLGVSPLFIEKASGSKAWDIDGNEYIDFANGLCSVNLGHCDPDVTASVETQLKSGVIFTLPHRLEKEVAEKMTEMIPCAEMVRFGKNGSDATAGAIRLSRAYTGREHVAACGYHGWQDWYIGSTARNKGVPKAVQALTHLFNYNDLPSLEKIFHEYPEQIAAVMLEPMNTTAPQKGFLEGIKALCEKNGAVFILDETITGFRFANGGAQELFGVTPDLATFGKGMANGFPVSAITGRRDIMKQMEEIFFSFTFGGETLSLAAALATMTKIQEKPVVETLRARGEALMTGTNALIEKHGLQSVLKISGHPSWSFLQFSDSAKLTLWQLKTLYLQEVFARGILTIGTHNMCYAHSPEDVRYLLKVYDEVFAILAEVIEKNNLGEYLFCKPLEPLFKVR